MNASAERLAEHGVGSIFLYTHEAHPGENYPEHHTMEDKIRAAQGLRDHYGVNVLEIRYAKPPLIFMAGMY